MLLWYFCLEKCLTNFSEALNPTLKYYSNFPKNVTYQKSLICYEDFSLAGFEANHRSAVVVVLLFLKYKIKRCTEHCNYDYHVVFNINKEGHYYARTHTDWIKTRETLTESTSCVGVDLLSNFHTSGWSSGSSDPCNEHYRGSAPMSSDEISYTKYKDKTAERIIMSLTITKTGSVISIPQTCSPNQTISPFLQTYMDKFAENSERFGYKTETGSYHDKHGTSTGHPVDYNTKYGLSFNWAMPASSVSTDPYQTDDSQLEPFMSVFSQGVFNMITHYETYGSKTTTAPCITTLDGIGQRHWMI